MIIFNNNSQTNFVFISFNEYDKVIKSYNITISFAFVESNRIISKSFINFYIAL